MYKLANKIKAARRVSAPLIYINSPDPNNSIHSIIDSLRDEDSEQCNFPVMIWNVNEGVQPVTDHAIPVIENMQKVMEDETLANPVDLLIGLKIAPSNSLIFMEHVSLFLDNPQVVQGLYTLRDKFKEDHRTLVGVGQPCIMPQEIRQSFVILDEPYPSPEEIGMIIDSIVNDIDDFELNHSDRTKSIDALRGLSAYTAEQEFSMCLSREGVDVDGLWDRKGVIVEQTKGLSVYRPDITLNDIGGCTNAKDFLSKLMLGKNPPKLIVWIDELDKATSADKTDTSGVSQDRLGFMLQYMEDNHSKGVILVGPPGTSKSMIAKGLGSLSNILTIRLDLGAMLGGIVGESQHNLREAFKVISAVADEDVLFIATCNSMEPIDSALQRRFKRGKIFCDLPDDDEKAVIWALHMNAHGLQKQDMPDDASWTGAEIASCCEMAYDMEVSLREAAEYIVPVAVTAKEEIDVLRKQAAGRFISASRSGFYQYDAGETGRKRRKVQL
jgi:hypothetical protein